MKRVAYLFVALPVCVFVFGCAKDTKLKIFDPVISTKVKGIYKWENCIYEIVAKYYQPRDVVPCQ